MYIDIEDINTVEKRNKVYTTQWKIIYEVIESQFFYRSDFLDDFIKKCKDNANEAINILIQVKNNIKRMVMEQGIYARVVSKSQKYLKFIATN